MIPVLSLLAVLLGCGADEAPSAERARRAEAGPSGPRAKPQVPAAGARRAGPDRHTVVFVVMDTVRAASTSLCGHDRPTTPFLEKLRDDHGAVVSCEAYSPASWTVPSHTSYFTGLPVVEHGHDAVRTPLAEDGPELLAERFARRGYQTAMVAANPVFRASGLDRGFEHVRIADSMKALREGFADGLRATLADLDADKPLFLFVNLIDAHDPYPAIPQGVDWVPAQKEISLNVRSGREGPYHRYLSGEMPQAEADRWLTALRDGYDWGIAREDEHVRELFRELRAVGRGRDDVRLVLTSDHGEYFGEHGLLRHPTYLWEPGVHVPFLFLDTELDAPPALPSPLSALVAWQLLQTGALPDPLPPVEAYARTMPDRPVKPGHDQIARWTPGAPKLLWSEGEVAAYDLSVDPGEETPLDPAGHPSLQGLEALVPPYRAHLEATASGPSDPELVQSLRELGYLE